MKCLLFDLDRSYTFASLFLQFLQAWCMNELQAISMLQSIQLSNNTHDFCSLTPSWYMVHFINRPVVKLHKAPVEEAPLFSEWPLANLDFEHKRRVLWLLSGVLWQMYTAAQWTVSEASETPCNSKYPIYNIWIVFE